MTPAVRLDAIAFLGFALALPCAAGPAEPTALSEPTVIETGRTVELRLGRGDEHRYAIVLAAGEYARVVVEQRGVDVIASVRGADSSAIEEFEDDIRTVGCEQVEMVADSAGVYGLAIRTAPGTVGPGSYAVRLAERRPATDADRELQESRRLRAIALRLYDQGRFDLARSRLERALALTEAARGADDLQTAAVAAQLAVVCRDLPDQSRAEALFSRALSILETSVGPDHATTAVVRSWQAALYVKNGQRAKAEATLRRALDGIEKALGPESRWFVDGLLTLANLRQDGGDYEEEEEVLRHALAIMERTEDTDSGLYAMLLSTLGEASRQKQDFARAEELYQRSLAVATRALGEDGYFVSYVLQNLGIVARERKDYAGAQAYNARALSIRERAVGPNHPDVAQLLNNIAIIYRAQGDIPKSLATHLRALGIWEHAAGLYQDATLVSVGNLARTYAAAHDLAHAIAYQQRTDTILEKQLSLGLAVGSERQRLLFAKSVAARTDRTVSLHLIEAPEDPAAGALAALVLLQRKGRVQDAVADTFAAARLHAPDARDRDLLDQLKDSTAQLAHVALSAADPARADERLAAIRELEGHKERLEADLSEHIAEFRAQVQPVTLEAVQAALPPEAALLEFAVFHPFDPRAERNAEAYGPPHYAAYVMRAQGPPTGVDLGSAEAIDSAIDAWRQALRDPRRADVRDRARAVDQRVMEPLRSALGDAARLLISPDGELNLVPFEALVDASGRYLIERYATSYLTSGRDLLRMQIPRGNSGAPVIFADPLFGEPGRPGDAPPVRKAGSVRTARRGVAAGADLSTVYFAPLAATAEEARAIKALFPESVVFTGPRARKSTLQRVEAPRMLHIASHGFFLPDARAAVENPLLRSGLALAGANLRQDAHGDGILTAMEASGLDLWGTRLVTLSACDTGLGEVHNGEGVYGLRRAFVLAGAETLVMSLWPVSDSVSRETMVAYYTRLRAGLGRGDALRWSKLDMLKRPARQHPYYWAGFIQSGEWARLDGVR